MATRLVRLLRGEDESAIVGQLVVVIENWDVHRDDQLRRSSGSYAGNRLEVRVVRIRQERCVCGIVRLGLRIVVRDIRDAKCLT